MRKKSKGRVKKFDEEHNIVEFKKRSNAKIKRIEGLDGYETFDPSNSFDAKEFVEEFIDEGRSKLKREAEEYDALEIKRPREEEKKKLTPRQKSRMRRRALIYLLVIAILVALIAFPIHKIVTLKIEERHLVAEQKQLEQQKKDLKEDLEKVNDPEYIEQQARKQLNLIKPGETLYVLPEDEKDGEKGKD